MKKRANKLIVAEINRDSTTSAPKLSSGAHIRSQTPTSEVGKPDFHFSEHRKPFNTIIVAAKTNPLLSQNPRHDGWGTVDWRLKGNLMFKATFHPELLFLPCNDIDEIVAESEGGGGGHA